MVIAVPPERGAASAEIAPAGCEDRIVPDRAAGCHSQRGYRFWGIFFRPHHSTTCSSLGGSNNGGVGLPPPALILAIMIVPYIAAITFDVCRCAAFSARAALALGATRWQTIRSAILPYASPGIPALASRFGPALGETMAVTMLIGNNPHSRAQSVRAGRFQPACDRQSAQYHQQ